MRTTGASFHLAVVSAVLTLASVSLTHAATGAWTGSQDAFWTNSANWSASPYPSGGDAATFAGASANTLVDVLGLSGVLTITFDTAGVAAYTIGAGAANSQTNILRDGGEIKLAAAAGNSQTFNSLVRLGPDSANAGYSLRNDNPGQTLTFSAVAGMSGGDKALTFNGAGPITLQGVLDRTGSNLDVYNNSTGALTLAANSNLRQLQINGAAAIINLGAGTTMTVGNGGGPGIMAAQDCTINGPGAISLNTGGGENYADNGAASGKTLTINARLTGPNGFEFWHSSYRGTIALNGENDFAGNILFNVAATISVAKIGNQGSTASNCGKGTSIIFRDAAGGRLLYTGTGETTDRILDMRNSGIVEMSGSGCLNFSSPPYVNGSRTLTLQGSTAGTGEISGALTNALSIQKSGAGAWALSASNTYSGATTVSAGCLALCGTNGAIRSSSGISLAGGCLALLNSAETNNTDRLADGIAITLNGGTLCFSNALTAATYSETAGALVVSSGASTIAATQAPDLQTSTLRFASVARTGEGTVNFAGDGLGDSDRNRIFITGQGDGLIGSWATVNGSSYAAYSSSRGVYAAPAAVDIAARGYSVITNDATLAARISVPGDAGPIVLETSPVSSVGALIQNSETPAEVITTNTLLKISDVVLAAGKASLTIGTEPLEGSLSALSPGGRLSLENNSSNAVLTINARVVTNASACGLVKLGAGTAVLAGENTYAGATLVNRGELAFGAGNHAIGQLSVGTASFLLTNAAATYVYVTNNSAYIGNASGEFGRMVLGGNCAWSGYLYPKGVSQTTLVIGNSGRGILTIQDNASVTQKLYVGNNGGSAGAVYQSGGVMHNWGGSTSDPRIGMYGYGYYELNSGTFTNNGWTQLGFDPQSVGILRQTGGAFRMGNVYDGNLGISRGGTGVVYLAGGTFNASATVDVGEQWDNSSSRGFAEFTIAGGAADINGNVYMADRENMFAAVNLNGGTLTANMINRAARASSVAVVSFDGGTLRARTVGNLFGVSGNAPNAVTIYDGGATFDTAGRSSVIGVPLRAPAGNGVTAISVAARDGYIGPPMVTITGGGGTGATAVAQFDSASGTVTGVQVTSPGFGYTSAPAVRLSGGGTNVQTAVTGVTLGANAGGGLTKTGTGGLTLAATNTYSGATTISNGFLRLGVAEGVPTNSALVIAGGLLDLGGFSYTNGAVTVTGGGAIVNGALTCGSLLQTGGGTLALGGTLSSPTPVQITEGVLQIQPVQAGLYEATLAGSFNTADPNPQTNTALTTRMANIVYNEPYNTTWIYSGYLWNRAATNATWTFAENFDDNVLLVVDGTTVINGGASWNTPTIGTLTLAPGAHAFEARFGQGGGGGGPVNSSWWTTTAIGFGVDYLGRNETNIANYVALADPGDGSLLSRVATSGGLTNRITSEASVELGAAGVLDLGTNAQSQTLANLSGSGVVSNGVLAVTGAITPGGTNAVGSLTVANSAGLSGTLRVDVAADGTCDRLVVAGDLALSGLSLEVANPAQLNRQKAYTVLTCSGTRTGAFSAVSGPDGRWRVLYKADGSVQLIFVDGSLLKLR